MHSNVAIVFLSLLHHLTQEVAMVTEGMMPPLQVVCTGKAVAPLAPQQLRHHFVWQAVLAACCHGCRLWGGSYQFGVLLCVRCYGLFEVLFRLRWLGCCAAPSTLGSRLCRLLDMLLPLCFRRLHAAHGADRHRVVEALAG